MAMGSIPIQGTYKNQPKALAGVAQWTEHQPANQRVTGWIPSLQAGAWVVGQVPSRGRVRGNHALMFLSLSFSLPSPLSKTKNLYKKKKP